jgi:hypothetical protein
MNGRGFARLAPLAGTAFVAIVVVVIALEGAEPSENALPADVLTHRLDWSNTSLLGTRDATVPVIDTRQLHAETGVAPAFEGVDDA